MSRLIRRRTSAVPNRCRGAVTVEMALALPILLLVVFASVDFARLNMLRNSAENAAYEGARRAIVPGATADDAKQASLAVLQAVGAANPTVTVTPNPIPSDAVSITVSVSLPLKNNAWTASAARTTKNLVKSCTMSRERTRSK